MKRIYTFYFFISILFFKDAIAQVPNNQDCLGAIPVCQSVYTQTNSYTGTGNFPNEINSGNSCLSSGEKNDVWYIFTISSPGNLNFTITPNNLSDDYDWALYNLTNATCAQIFTNSNLEVSCNYSGTSGVTGPNGGSALNSQNAGGTPFNATVPATIGQTYALNVSNFSSSQSGYVFDLHQTTAGVFDTLAPHPKEITSTPPGSPLACGLNKINLKFSENIECNSVDTNDIAIQCPNGILHKITSVQCKSVGTYSNSFDLTVFPAFTDSAIHKLYLTRIDSTAITDLCGNSSFSSLNHSLDTISFRIKGIKKTQIITDVNCFGDSTGLAKIVPSNGTSPYTYSWLTNPSKISQSITNLKAGSYISIIKDSKGCSRIDTVLIKQQNPLVPSYTASLDTCGKGTAVAIAAVIGGKKPYAFNWNDVLQQTNDTATHLHAGNYLVTIIDSLGCDTILSVDVVTPPLVHPLFDYDPKAISLFFPDCNFTDLSQNAISWHWNFGDGDTSMHQNPFHKFFDEGTYPVKLVVENTFGCEDSIIIDVYVDGFYTLFLPTSFTPNGDGKNDQFLIRGSGVLEEKFDLKIYARNGQMVYHTNEMTKGWDGNLSGSQAQSESYVYDITFTDYKFKEHNKKGVITLAR